LFQEVGESRGISIIELKKVLAMTVKDTFSTPAEEVHTKHRFAITWGTFKTSSVIIIISHLKKARGTEQC
jgi:hypothetical protein